MPLIRLPKTISSLHLVKKTKHLCRRKNEGHNYFFHIGFNISSTPN